MFDVLAASAAVADLGTRPEMAGLAVSVHVLLIPNFILRKNPVSPYANG